MLSDPEPKKVLDNREPDRARRTTADDIPTLGEPK